MNIIFINERISTLMYIYFLNCDITILAAFREDCVIRMMVSEELWS